MKHLMRVFGCTQESSSPTLNRTISRMKMINIRPPTGHRHGNVEQHGSYLMNPSAPSTETTERGILRPPSDHIAGSRVPLPREKDAPDAHRRQILSGRCRPAHTREGGSNHLRRSDMAIQNHSLRWTPIRGPRRVSRGHYHPCSCRNARDVGLPHSLLGRHSSNDECNRRHTTGPGRCSECAGPARHHYGRIHLSA